jgi:hypothetical protein
VRAFRWRDGSYVAGLDGAEREVLATVVADVAELLGAGRFDRPDDDADRADRERSGLGSGHPGHPLGLAPNPDVVPAPEDPAVRRLLPDASDDREVAAEFRRLTDHDLRRVKIDRLRSLWDALVAAPDAARGDATPWDDVDAELAVRPEDAPAVAATLTDLRLVLADRLGIESDADSEALYDALDRRELEEQLDDDAAARSGRSAREELEDEIRAYLGSVYAALTWLQESLLTVMVEDLP